MPDNAQRDANISRLFEKLDYVVDKVTLTQNEISVIGTKVDDFNLRLRRLEEREEKHLEREEKLEVLTTKMEAIIIRGESTMEKLDSRIETMESKVGKMESDIAALKKNWRILIGITTLISSLAGYIVKTMVDVILKGG